MKPIKKLEIVKDSIGEEYYFESKGKLALKINEIIDCINELIGKGIIDKAQEPTLNDTINKILNLNTSMERIDNYIKKKYHVATWQDLRIEEAQQVYTKFEKILRGTN